MNWSPDATTWVLPVVPSSKKHSTVSPLPCRQRSLTVANPVSSKQFVVMVALHAGRKLVAIATPVLYGRLPPVMRIC